MIVETTHAFVKLRQIKAAGQPEACNLKLPKTKIKLMSHPCTRCKGDTVALLVEKRTTTESMALDPSSATV